MGLIERNAAIDEWENDFKEYINALNMPRDDYNGIMEYISELPSAQPEPKRGKWESQSGGRYCCSECGRYAMDKADGRTVMISVKSKFCPNCGADMRGEQDG